MDIQGERVKRQKEALDMIAYIAFILKIPLLLLLEFLELLSFYIKLLSNPLRFWTLSIIMFAVSALIIHIMSYTIFVFQYAFIGTESSLAFIKFGEIFSSSDNAKSILSSLSQIQASIFGIFFTLCFLMFQIQIQNRSTSPRSMTKTLKSKKLVFIMFIFIVSITFDIILIGSVDNSRVNIFWVLTLFLFSILMLFTYTIVSLLDLSHNEIVEEILAGGNRVNLEGANLERIVLKEHDLNNLNLARTNLYRSDLRRASINRSNLSVSNLKWANLKEASLSFSNLSYSKLVGANLIGAKLDGTNLKKADLTWIYCGKNESLWPGWWILFQALYNVCPKILWNKGEASCSQKSLEYRSEIIRHLLENKDFFDETILLELLKAKNLCDCILDDILLEALIEKAKELRTKPGIDIQLKDSIELFLSSKGN